MVKYGRKTTRKEALLRLIADLGGEGTREQINAHIPKYWDLSEYDREDKPGTGKPRFWGMSAGVCQNLKDIDGYLDNPRWGVWRITAAGREHLRSVVASFAGTTRATRTPSGPAEAQSVSSQSPGVPSPVKRLQQTQHRSAPREQVHFERALADALTALGLMAEHKGGRAPDVLVTQPEVIIFDAKSTERPRIVSVPAMGFDALADYREEFKASFVGVVGPDFSKGKVRSTAVKRGVVLITTEAICRLLQNHRLQPYDPRKVVEILFESGKSYISPEEIPLPWGTLDEALETFKRLLPDEMSGLKEGLISLVWTRLCQAHLESVKPTVALPLERVSSKTPGSGGMRPRILLIANEALSISKWYEILTTTAEWLIRKGKLSTGNCPVKAGHKRYLVHSVGRHSDGSSFGTCRKLSNGLFIETKFNKRDCVEHARRLLEECGFPKDILDVQ